MENRQAAMAFASQRRKAFLSLLDPTNLMPGQAEANIYALRQLCLQGSLPESPEWIRSQAWKVLLEYLPAEKRDWAEVLSQRRADYYQFLQDFLPQSLKQSDSADPAALSERDMLLDQLYKDLSRSRKNTFSFYQSPVPPSTGCPLAPLPTARKNAVKRLDCRHDLLKRLEQINHSYALENVQKKQTAEDSKGKARVENGHAGADSLAPPFASTQGSASGRSSPTSFISADDEVASRGAHDVESEAAEGEEQVDLRWHGLLRILYVYALLNPSIGYIQGMNEIVFIFLYAFGSGSAGATAIPSDSDHTDAMIEWNAHAEADAFWCFSALIGEVRDLFDFDALDHSAAGLHVTNVRARELGNAAESGMAGALKKFSMRLKWLDEELWRVMRDTSLDPRLPYYSFRWLACLLSTELALPSILRVWDVLLAEQSSLSADLSRADAPTKIDILIDICCALLVRIREEILVAAQPRPSDSEADGTDGPFARCMWILQHYPDNDIEPVLEMAHLYRQRRLASALTGDGPPLDDEPTDAKSVRDRANKMYQSLRKSSSPQIQSSKSWFSSVGRSISGQTAPAEGGTTSPSRGNVFNRYAEALQSSDTAASLSKMGTNLTAKALSTWHGGPLEQQSPQQQQRVSSLTIARQDLIARAREATFGRSTSNPVPVTQTPTHPAIGRFSRMDLPSFPLPNVVDTPEGKQEYSGEHERSTQALRAMFMPPSPANGDGPPSSPRVLPSMRAMAAHSRDSSATKTGNGPKPLLLTGAARPPRETSGIPPSPATPGQSRKVSTGPLASNGSSIASPASSRRNQSHHGSVSTRDSQASSDAGSALGIDEKLVSNGSTPKASGTVQAGVFARNRQAKGADLKANMERMASEEEERRRAAAKLEGEKDHGHLAELQSGETAVAAAVPDSPIPIEPSGATVGVNAAVVPPGLLPAAAVVDGKRVSLFEQPRAAPLPPPVAAATERQESNQSQNGSIASLQDVRPVPLRQTSELSLSAEDSVERYKLSDAPVPSLPEAASPQMTSEPARQDSLGKSSSGRLARSRMASRRTNSASSTRSNTRSSGGVYMQDIEPISEGNSSTILSEHAEEEPASERTAADFYETPEEPHQMARVPGSHFDSLKVKDATVPLDLPSPGAGAGELLDTQQLLESLGHDLNMSSEQMDEISMRTPLADAHTSIGALVAIADNEEEEQGIAS